jgi:hypothetical protein
MKIFTTLRYSINHKHSTNNIAFTKSNQHQKNNFNLTTKFLQISSKQIFNLYNLDKTKSLKTFNQYQPNISYQTDITQQPNKIQQPSN